MRLTRILTVAVTTTLVGSATAALPAPAQAGTDRTGTTTIAKATTRPVVYGGTTSITGHVTAADKSTVYGTVTLYAGRAAAGKHRRYTVVGHDDSPKTFRFSNLQPRRNTVYVVAFTSVGTNYRNSTDRTTVRVRRHVTIRNPHGLLLKGKVRPDYKHKRVVVQRKKGGHWKAYRVVRTNKRSRFHVRLSAPRQGRRHFRVTVPGSKNYLRYRERWYTTSSRPITRVTTR